MTTVNKWSQGGATITSAPSVDCDKVTEMISRLRSAADTLQRFGEGTRSSKRIRRTLVKLVQICMTLAQFSPEYGPVILSTLSSQQQLLDAASQLRAQLESGISMQDAAGLDGTVLATGAMGTTTISADDPFTVFDMNMPHYWTDTNLDLFSDLVGVDTGIAAMLSG
jgi:hypothetical protein